MNRLNKLFNISVFILSALVADACYTPVYAQSVEAREFNRKGVTALESGNYSESVQFLKKAMELEPKWGEPCFNAARLLRLNNKREEMTKMLRKANAVEPDNPKYLEEYIKVLIENLDNAVKAANNSEASKIRNEILRVNPGNLTVGLQLVKAHLSLSEKDEALDIAQDLVEKNSRFRSKYDVKEMGELYFIAAKILADRGDRELANAKNCADNATKFDFPQRNEAKELYKKLRERISVVTKELLDGAAAAQKSGNPEMAESLLSQAAELNPDSDGVKSATIQFKDTEDINKTISKAEKLNRSGRWLEAREVLTKLSEKYPEDNKVRNMLSSFKSKEDELLKAIGRADLPTSLEGRKGILIGFKDGGVKFYKAGNYESASIALKRALALVDQDKALDGYRAEIEEVLEKIKNISERKENWGKAIEARNSGDYEDSLKWLKKLPEDYDIQMDSYLAEAYYKTGDSVKAEEYALRQIGKQPENNRAKFVLGCIAMEAKDPDRAHRYFSEIYASDPDYPELSDKLAYSSLKYLPAVLGISALLLVIWIAWTIKKKMPIYNKNAKIDRAKYWFKKEVYDDCISTLIEIRRSPYLTPADNLEITRLFAQSYLKKARYDLAIGECKHLISMMPKSEEAHTWLGYAYLGRRMLAPEALPELLNLYKKDSRNIALVSLLGSYYAQQKNLTDEGVEILEQWLNLDYDNVEVLKPLGRYYLKKNRSDDKAMKVFQKMVEIGSPEPEFMLGVASVYLKKRLFDNCLQLCEQVINADINNEYVHSVLLEAYKKQDRLSELLDIYANFLKSNPYNVAFQNGLRAAQAVYDKIQNRNAAQAAAEAAVVMEKMRGSFDAASDWSENETGEGFPQAMAPGEVPCPTCGKPNQNGSYTCQHCGANMFQ